VLVAVAAAKGSPGVTATARLIASVWPDDVVLADCDPAGGDIALLGRGRGGTVLDPDRGLLSLAADARHGLAHGALADHLQELEGGLPVLCGVSSPEQVTAIGPVWPTIAAAFAQTPGPDVVVDCGRVTAGTPVLPVLNAADVVLFVVRPRLEGFAHLRERLRWLATVQRGLAAPPAVGVVLIAEGRAKDSTDDLGRVLAHDGLQMPILGPLADDPRAADALAARIDRGIGRSLLVRSARLLVDPVRQLGTRRATVHGRI
jgi:MinD-like ATPase involved in chromosome partitioning or flagellar assembly